MTMYEGQVMKQMSGYGSTLAGSTIGGASGYMADAQRKPELVEQMDRLEQAINRADETLMRLRDRLDNGSLRQAAPATNGEGKLCSAPPSSGHASSIFAFTERLSAMTDRVCDLLQRLEV